MNTLAIDAVQILEQLRTGKKEKTPGQMTQEVEKITRWKNTGTKTKTRTNLNKTGLLGPIKVRSKRTWFQLSREAGDPKELVTEN